MSETGMTAGFTLAGAAAAAAVAALRFLQGQPCSRIKLQRRDGDHLYAPVMGCRLTEKGAEAWVTHDAGDNSHITHGSVIVANVEIWNKPGTEIIGGEGIGVAMKSGLPVALGRAAINQMAVELIRDAVEVELPDEKGARVIISIPAGEKLAKRTYNPRLGIIGGLSIFERDASISPMSAEGIAEAIRSELSGIREVGVEIVCMTPGNYGRRMAMIQGIPECTIVNVGNFFGEALTCAGNLGYGKLLLIGQIGKFSKVASGSFDTHNSKSDGRLETLAAYSAIHGASAWEVRSVLDGAMPDEVASRMLKTTWGAKALDELLLRATKRVISGTTGVSECACLTFSLPDRELARTENLVPLIEEIVEEAKKIKRGTPNKQETLDDVFEEEA